MRRRWLLFGVLMATALGVASLMRAVADNFDPAEKHCAQNLKRLGQALAMYLNDYDDHFPLAYQRFSPSEPWQWDTPVAVPRNWQDGSPSGGWTWVNALSFYTSNAGQVYKSFYCPATLPAKLPNVDYSQRVRSPMPVSYTYNGYLHSYRLALVADPSTLPTIWEGLGREHWLGFAPVNPLLRCDRASGKCEFVPCTDPATTYPLGEVRLPRQSVWIHRSGVHFVMLDGKLVTRRLGARIAPSNTNPQIDPFDGYNAQGVPSLARTNACGHLPLFTPQ
ncbi:MAG: hypothetical protein K6U12_03175 [Armatimonadetes bacterium]|nr:hypothetical protein [Armatimonadota bacterium]CUU38072.1 hypothetical protein DCOP10_123133 [Armatimonadetes bacterium DC]